MEVLTGNRLWLLDGRQVSPGQADQVDARHVARTYTPAQPLGKGWHSLVAVVERSGTVRAAGVSYVVR